MKIIQTDKSCPLCQAIMKDNHCLKCGFESKAESEITSKYSFQPYDSAKNVNNDFIPKEVQPEHDSEEIYPQRKSTSNFIEETVVEHKTSGNLVNKIKKEKPTFSFKYIVPALLIGIVLGQISLKTRSITKDTIVMEDIVTVTSENTLSTTVVQNNDPSDIINELNTCITTTELSEIALYAEASIVKTDAFSDNMITEVSTAKSFNC